MWRRIARLGAELTIVLVGEASQAAVHATATVVRISTVNATRLTWCVLEHTISALWSWHHVAPRLDNSTRRARTRGHGHAAQSSVPTIASHARVYGAQTTPPTRTSTTSHRIRRHTI